MKTYKAEELSPEETSRILQQMRSGALAAEVNPFKREHRAMILSAGFELKGSFDLVARNVETGDVEWQHQQDNLVTDYGRIYFAVDGWASVCLGFMPSKEAPAVGRNNVPTDGSQCVVINVGVGTVTANTYTRSWGPVTYGAPAANRTLGSVFVSVDTTLYDHGPRLLFAYAVLSPSKVQTTLQTVELNYKISMSPIV